MNEQVLLDFDQVSIVTNSFADECFGKLRASFPDNVFKSKILFINANDFVQRVIISTL